MQVKNKTNYILCHLRLKHIRKKNTIKLTAAVRMTMYKNRGIDQITLTNDNMFQQTN
jgi:hypothetical protein